MSFKKGHKINLGRVRSEKVRKKISDSMRSSVNVKLRKGECSGENHLMWKGGKKKSTHGYWLIWKPNHPFHNKQNYVRQSRLLAEKIIGRYLTSKEQIHHINGIKDDDRPENLYLFDCLGEHMRYHRLKIKPELKSNLRCP